MLKENVLQEIKESNPKIIYLSGKTCTGKTTFANEMKDRGYSQIELDTIVMNSLVVPFNIQPHWKAFFAAYRDEGSAEQIETFINAAKKEIKEKIKSSAVVIEGAVAKSRILKAIFSEGLENFFFIYFHPVNLDVYTGRIQERFIAGVKDGTSGLPKQFWGLTDEKDVEEFLKTNILNDGIKNSIKHYAQLSMKDSEGRLNDFKESFSNIHVIEF